MFFFFTHDAIPAENVLIERMLATLASNPQTAVVYGRQLPREDATYTEKLVRTYNYPTTGYVYDAKDIPQHGIKTFFMSDVCHVSKGHLRKNWRL